MDDRTNFRGPTDDQLRTAARQGRPGRRAEDSVILDEWAHIPPSMWPERLRPMLAGTEIGRMWFDEAEDVQATLDRAENIKATDEETEAAFAASVDNKPTNPKDAVAVHKVPLSNVPAVSLAWLAAAHQEGMIKYGANNWAEAGVRASVYLNAANRHLKKWQNGERVDAKTLIHHLGNAMACCSILIDAETRGMLVDDRPPPIPNLDAAFDEITTALAKLPRPATPPRHVTALNFRSNKP